VYGSYDEDGVYGKSNTPCLNCVNAIDVDRTLWRCSAAVFQRGKPSPKRSLISKLNGVIIKGCPYYENIERLCTKKWQMVREDFKKAMAQIDEEIADEQKSLSAQGYDNCLVRTDRQTGRRSADVMLGRRSSVTPVQCTERNTETHQTDGALNVS
jgi:hypothetical protein